MSPEELLALHSWLASLTLEVDKHVADTRLSPAKTAVITHEFSTELYWTWFHNRELVAKHLGREVTLGASPWAAEHPYGPRVDY